MGGGYYAHVTHPPSTPGRLLLDKAHLAMASLLEDVAAYEAWLRKHCAVVEDDLAAKHQRMRASPFDFLRATYFRWARTVHDFAPELLGTPEVLSVGDTHVENFGTWRDEDSRQVWGANDFDEASVMPYPLDLLRLVVSARLAPDFKLGGRETAKEMLGGYVEGLQSPQPILLEQGAKWFRTLVNNLEDKSAGFWREVDAYADATPPEPVQSALRGCLPKGATIQRFATRRSGGGSLGRPRYLAIALWQGGRIVREAKAVVPSAWDWAAGRGETPSRILDAAFGRFRSPDPTLSTSNGFLLRQIASDAQKLDLKDVSMLDEGTKLVRAMGAEIGAIHAGQGDPHRLLEDLARRDPDWLQLAAKRAQQSVEADHALWMKHLIHVQLD